MSAILSFFKRDKKEQETKKSDLPPKEKTTIKVVFIGRSYVGAKTSLIRRYVDNTFNYGYSVTISIDLIKKTVTCRGREVEIDILDTSGHELSLYVSLAYARGSDGAVIGYSVTDKKSYEEAKEKCTRLKKDCPDAIVMLIGNKVDLEEQREVTTEEGEEFARSLNIPLFFESK